MTETLYLQDAYTKEMDARVLSISNNEVELDRTVFYPSGGGEPCDTGHLQIGPETYSVAEVKKEGDRILHVLDRHAPVDVNTAVHGTIDWDKRYAYMRYHTATHVIDGIILNKYNGVFTGGQIYSDRAHDDFDMPGLNRELALKILQEAQQVIDEGHPVVARTLSNEEALKIPDLVRTNPGRELIQRLQHVRVVEIVGFDSQMDGGLHVANTREIGKLELMDFENKGAHRKRIGIRIA